MIDPHFKLLVVILRKMPLLRNIVILIGVALSISPISHSVPANGESGQIPVKTRNEVPKKSKKVILSIKDDGLSEPALKLSENDGSVFFFNDSSSNDVMLSVFWGKRAAHCASENLILDKSGSLHTVKPMKRKDFSFICFPEAGEYSFIVNGLPVVSGKKSSKSNSGEIHGKIIVP